MIRLVEVFLPQNQYFLKRRASTHIDPVNWLDLEKSIWELDEISVRSFCIEWTRHFSLCCGKSLLKWPPLDSSRQSAARVTSNARETKFRDDVLSDERSICSNSAIARVSESLSRSIPTRSHITRLTRFLTAVLMADRETVSDDPSTGSCRDLPISTS